MTGIVGVVAVAGHHLTTAQLTLGLLVLSFVPEMAIKAVRRLHRLHRRTAPVAAPVAPVAPLPVPVAPTATSDDWSDFLADEPLLGANR